MLPLAFFTSRMQIAGKHPWREERVSSHTWREPLRWTWAPCRRHARAAPMPNTHVLPRVRPSADARRGGDAQSVIRGLNGTMLVSVPGEERKSAAVRARTPCAAPRLRRPVHLTS
jgi:hypothetical protein